MVTQATRSSTRPEQVNRQLSAYLLTRRSKKALRSSQQVSMGRWESWKHGEEKGIRDVSRLSRSNMKRGGTNKTVLAVQFPVDDLDEVFRELGLLYFVRDVIPTSRGDGIGAVEVVGNPLINRNTCGATVRMAGCDFLTPPISGVPCNLSRRKL